MRKTVFVRTLCCGVNLFCIAAIGLACVRVFAQDATAALPSDPKELMLLAAKSNGLTGPDVQPWRLKATYTLLDNAGNAIKQGTIDELWVSPTKFKYTFTDADSTQTQYGTEKGIVLSGDKKPQFFQADQVRNEIVSPLPKLEAIARDSYVLQQREAGAVKLSCLRLKDANGDPFGLSWCLEADKPILRFGGGLQGKLIVHNRIVRFQNRYIPGDLRFMDGDKLVLTAHIETVERLATVDEAAFVPPPDATTKSQIISIGSGVAAGLLIKKVPPEYPAALKAIRAEGIVVLKGEIGEDGRLHELHVVSGPANFHQAALDAVEQWVYRPFLLNGEPVAVMTTINVIFGNPLQ